MCQSPPTVYFIELLSLLSVQEWLGMEFIPRAKVCTVPLLLAGDCKVCYRSKGRADVFDVSSMGMATLDATQQWLPLGWDEARGGMCFAVELKPKQAENARSWLVNLSTAPFKSRFTRIGITRAATGGGKPAPALDADYEALFSGELNSVRRVIKASLGQQHGPVVSCFLEGERVRSPANPSRAAAIVASALAREPILRRLRIAQQAFDCLDIDGVAIALVVPQLVGLDVEAHLEYRSVGTRLSPKAEAAEEVCRCAPGLLAATKLKLREVRRKEAILSLYELEESDLLDLVYNWLVALALDDLSIIVSAIKLSGPISPHRQTNKKMGVIRLHKVSFYAYAIAVIDAGPKRPCKLRRKVENEPGLIACAEAVF